MGKPWENTINDGKSLGLNGGFNGKPSSNQTTTSLAELFPNRLHPIAPEHQQRSKLAGAPAQHALLRLTLEPHLRAEDGDGLIINHHGG